jgi:1-acyl-sn-glycerol-3-phosphate acyltransferase
MFDGMNYLEQKCSVMFFPEGTRSKDGTVGTFNDGAFHLAIRAGVPVLPLVIDGTSDALPKNSWKFTNPGPIRLKVLPPVPTAGLAKGDAPELNAKVRSMIVAQLQDWRGGTDRSQDPVRVAMERALHDQT